jgi:mannose-1-phosphate guanylyltransferase/mannose-6-phosphate isomerase
MGDNLSTMYAVLLAGGSGSRLWPVSRELFPKQLVNFIGEDSLVQATVKRLLPVVPAENIRIVCGREHFHEMARHLEEIGIAAGGKIICEPCGRNTAPAVLLAVMHILSAAADAIVGVFPADHVIRDIAGFHDKLGTALRLADAGHVVTFGITAHYPETGYGYIEGTQSLPDGARVCRRFVEKPDLATARQYLESGNFYWNSGMFAFRASVIVEEFQRYCPDLLQDMQLLMQRPGELSGSGYGRLPDVSIDYAIMEKTRKGVVLPSDFGWSDIGSWKSLYEFLPKNSDNNVLFGDVIAQRTRNSFVMGRERLIAVNNLDGLVIIETPDSIFVSDLETSRDVKDIVTRLKDAGRDEAHHHRTVYHPWGSETLLERRPHHCVCRLVLYPGAAVLPDSPTAGLRVITVVEGRGRRTTGRKKNLRPGDAVTIAAGEGLGIVNVGNAALTLLQLELYPPQT